MKVTFWGTRGSIATPGPETLRYGGNTSCVQAVTDAGTLIILDCGTGGRLLGNYLVATWKKPIRGHILFTHTHWDHIQGFPFFTPAFIEGNEFLVYGPSDGELHLEEALAGQMQYTYFPVELEHIGASVSCIDLAEGDLQLDDVTVTAHYLNHPAVTLGYRVQSGGASLVYATDHEPFSPVLFRQGAGSGLEAILHPGDRGHADFLADADLVIHDTQYTSEEYEAHRNWGHSNLEYVVEIALAARVRQLAVYHHDPSHDDACLDAMEERARSLVAQHGSAMQVFVAREGQTIELSEDRESRQPAAGGGRQAIVSPPRVLVIEDEVMILELVREILEPEGYFIDAATSGQEGLEKARAFPPDLMLLDMRLPHMDGIEVLNHLRTTPEGRSLPVIMLTAVADEDWIERGFRAGATDYMMKPFSPPQLRARINGWLHRATEGRASLP